MKKRLFAILLAFALCVVFAACGNSASSSTSSTSNSTSQTSSQSNSSNDTASSWPTGPVTIIVPAGAGGGTDLLARVAAEKLTQKLGQSFVVVTVTGAGGSNGTGQVYEAAPDGNTILFYHNAILTNYATGVTDYTYSDFDVGPHIVTDGATGFYVRSDAPYQTYPELIEYATAHPGEVVMATEVGGFTYMMVKSFERATGVTFNIVDVGGNADKCTALLGGHIDIMPNQYSTAAGYIESGDFVALGFPIEERSAVYPDVPTAKEQGVDWLYNGYEFTFLFPKGTPQSIQDTFNNTIKELFDNNEIQEDILKLGNDPTYMSPAEASQIFQGIQEEYQAIWAETQG